MTNLIDYAQKKINSAVFLGSKNLGLSVFKSLYAISDNLKWTIIHPNDADDPRSALRDWQNLAHLLDLDLLISSSKMATKEMIRDIRPDIGFVCGWYSLLDNEVLSFVPNGFWGIHNSLLPKYRGGSPLVWSIINGDECVGSTVFRISDGVDNGDVLLQARVKNELADTIETLLKKIEDSLLEALPDKWKLLVNGCAELTTQDESEATYCGQRIEADGNIDWSNDAVNIHNFIRAQSPPYPGAFTYCKGIKVAILNSRPIFETHHGTPGQILRLTSKSVVVSCGRSTAIAISEVLVDGEKFEASDYFKSYTLRLSGK